MHVHVVRPPPPPSSVTRVPSGDLISTFKACPATTQGKTCSGAGGGGTKQRQETEAWQRSASFHGRGAEQRLLPKQRPKTQPDLLSGTRGASSRSGSPDGGAGIWRTPSKVLVSVLVHVMSSAEWRVADLVAAAVGLYVKEGRRPLLASADPAAFGLHYSQFSLEGLDPSERVMELGSRSFFLSPKSSALGLVVSSPSSNGETGVTVRERWRNPGLAEIHEVLVSHVVSPGYFFHPWPPSIRCYVRCLQESGLHF